MTRTTVFLYRTKYIGGHTDVCAGVATASTVEQWKQLMMTRTAFGSILVGGLNIQSKRA